MGLYAILDNETGAAGKALNIAKSQMALNPGWIDITNEDPRPQIGWNYDGLGGWVAALPAGTKPIKVTLTDILKNGGSILDDEATYTVLSTDQVQLKFSLINTFTGAPINAAKTVTFIMQGLYNTPPFPFDAVFALGVGTANLVLPKGVFELNFESINFVARNNPSLQLEYEPVTTFVVK